MDASFFTSFATMVVGLGSGMALASILPCSKQTRRALFGPLIAVTMILGTRYGFLHGLGPQSSFSGNPTGQIIGVLLGVLVVWLVFFYDGSTRAGRMPPA